MSKVKYIARRNGEIVGKRTSSIPAAVKTYTHAVVIWGHGQNPKVKCWCSRLDLAQGEASTYRRCGFQTEIVPAEIVSK